MVKNKTKMDYTKLDKFVDWRLKLKKLNNMVDKDLEMKLNMGISDLNILYETLFLYPEIQKEVKILKDKLENILKQ